MSDLAPQNSNYKELCQNLQKRINRLVEDQSRSLRDAMRCRMISLLMREAQQLSVYNKSDQELDHGFLTMIQDTLDVDRAALLRYASQEGYFLVQSTVGFPPGAYPGFTPPHAPPKFFFVNDHVKEDPMMQCLLKAADTPNVLWAFAPHMEVALLLGKSSDSGPGDFPYSHEDRSIVEGALNVYDSMMGRKRAEDMLQRTKERLDLALQGADLGMWDWNIRTGEVIINDRWAEMLGYRTDEIESNISTWEMMLHPDDRPATLLALKAHLEGRTPVYEMEYRLATKEGDWKWILDKGRVVEWDSGKHPIRATGTHLDITERKQAEETLTFTMKQLGSSHDDLLSILNKLNVGTALFNEKGRITFLSQACQEYTGLRPEKVLNRPWEEVLPFKEKHIQQLKDMIALPIKERRRFSVDRWVQDGRPCFLDVEVMDDPRDRRKKILCLYDISEVQSLRLLLQEKGKAQELIGKTKSMRRVNEQIKQLSQVDATVLIEGETGTGKELVARALHYSSPRRDKPFVAVNCSGLTDSVLHSQLFGHKKGAFTGAITDQSGVFNAANGGTVFLDEIAGVSITVQVSLLRVLEEKEITPLGATTPKKIDIRILVATNQNLNVEVMEGRFRQDLLYRVRVAKIQLPPLNQRKDDIPLLARSFLWKYCAALGKKIEDFSSDTLQSLLDYQWPGNVRELKNAVEFAVIQSKQTIIYPECLPQEILDPSLAFNGVKESPVTERDHILAELKSAGGNRSAAARRMGISRATFYRRLAQLDIDPNKM